MINKYAMTLSESFESLNYDVQIKKINKHEYNSI